MKGFLLFLLIVVLVLAVGSVVAYSARDEEEYSSERYDQEYRENPSVNWTPEPDWRDEYYQELGQDAYDSYMTCNAAPELCSP